jgi:uncharacterized membrane protein (UPF0127 family)
MKIINLKTKEIISKNCIKCKTILSKTFGLMFSKKKDLIFIFDKEKIVPLHMVFVFFKINVLFVNKNYIIVDKKKDFLPFTFYTPKKKAKYVIEICFNNFENITIGDKLEFKN